MENKQPAIWRIQLKGRLRLIDPNDHEIVFSSSKSKSFVALLCLNQGGSMSRKQIGSILWSEFNPHQRQENLRQVVSQLRKLLPENSPIQIDRQNCWIDHSNIILSPNLEKANRNSIVPECSEPWFHRWRADETTFQELEDQELHADFLSFEKATTALQVLLEYSMHQKPTESLRAIETFNELAIALPPEHLYRIANTCIKNSQASDESLGWGMLARGVANSYLGKPSGGIAELEQVKRIALSQKNQSLFAIATLFHASSVILQGSPKNAIAALHDASKKFPISAQPQLVIRIHHALGLAEIHNGEFDKGLTSLETALSICPEYDLHSLRSHILANIAWMGATVNRISKASTHLEMLKISPAGKAWQYRATGILATAAIALNNKDFSTCKLESNRLLRFVEVTQAIAFIVYPVEMLALCALHEKEFDEARVLYNRSRKLRTLQNLNYSVWDTYRLSPLIEKFSV